MSQRNTSLLSKEEMYFKSLCIKVDRTEASLQEFGIVEEVRVVKDEERIIVHFFCIDSIYAQSLAKILNSTCTIAENTVMYEFDANLIYSSLSLANNFFTQQWENIEKLFNEKLINTIASIARKEFCELRSKKITEKDYRKLINDIQNTDDIIQYIADIRTIIENSKGVVCLFGQRYNQFFKVGHPPMRSIPEGENETEESKSNYELGYK
jgi:hypothetical protein